MLRLIQPILLILLLTLAACGAAGTGSPGTNSDVALPPTVTVGAETVSTEPPMTDETTSTLPVTVSVEATVVTTDTMPTTEAPVAPNAVATSTLAPLPAGTPPVAAKPAPAIPQDLSNVVISLQRTLCRGTCPVYTVTIYGDGRVVYVGEQFVTVTGEQVRTIPVEQVRALVEEFYRINFFGMQESYEALVTDLPSTITTLTIGDQTKSVLNYAAAPEELTALEQQIDKVAGTVEWVGER